MEQSKKIKDAGYKLFESQNPELKNVNFDDILVNTILKPFVSIGFIFALYVQISGATSIGGGFQAGSIVASIFILLLGIKTKNVNHVSKIFSLFSCTGVTLYFTCGIFGFFNGFQLMDYSVIKNTYFDHFNNGNKNGIILAELGVLIVVYSVLTMIYLNISKEKSI